MIFKIISNNPILEKEIYSLLEIKIDQRFSFSEIDNFLFVLKIQENTSETFLNSDFSKIIKIQKPFPFKSVLDAIDKILNSYEYNLQSVIYAPFRQELVNQEKKLKLTDIHNLILINLIIYQYKIDKNILYKKIWPKDKEIQINKLDTHLTNLKNLINQNLGYDLKFKTQKNILMID